MPRYVPPPTIQICQFPLDVDDCEIENDTPALNSRTRRRATRRKSTPSNFAPSSTQHHNRELRRIRSTGPPARATAKSLSDEDSDAHELPVKEDRQQAINRTHPFGIRVWNSPLYHQDNLADDGTGILIPEHLVSKWTYVFNILWTVIFGWWLSLLVLTAGIICLALARSHIQPTYGRVLCNLAGYILFPFNKPVRCSTENGQSPAGEREVSTSRQGEQVCTELEQDQLLCYPRMTYDTRYRTFEDSTDATSTRGWPEPMESPKFAATSKQWTAESTFFYVVLHILIIPTFLIVAAICWWLVLPLPMARMLVRLLRNLQSRALELYFERSSDPSLWATETGSTVLLYNCASIDVNSWKYSFGGVNIVLINLMAIATLTGFDWLILLKCLHLHSLSLSPSMLFFGSLLGIIPLAYVIGQAVASISTQSSMGISAAVNALFSTIFEVIFYCVALSQGKSELVEGCIIGSVLAGVLFLPGLSMCFGALKRKTQRFNSKSAGVTSTMLLFAMVGVFSPTLFYSIYGTYVIKCKSCTHSVVSDSQIASPNCRSCSVSQQLDLHEPLYNEMLRPFSYLCAFLLLLAYIIGLWFSLRTHSSVIWNKSEERPHDGFRGHHEPIRTQHRNALDNQQVSKRPAHPRRHHRMSSSGGMDLPQCDVISEVPELTQQIDQPRSENAPTGRPKDVQQIPGHVGSLRHVPNWGRSKSLLILLTATVFYCLLAVILIDAVDTILQEFYIEERFLGLTIFALIPNATEIWNAILFAVNGNIALSVEIGSAYALQVCLLQIPALVFFSAVLHPHKPREGHIFSMVLPQWDMFVVIFAVFLHGYMQNEGRSNYFKGSILLLSYAVIVVGFLLSSGRD
ncbi:calcium permease [Fusarium heterosporum]|uniref:Calcium permease n=1 Tax=Fusarium heterosporum TaxID=42747 RepID=A0A8H5T306_FUSHE|nr:calcium permease [Fusarium heterosporum]